MNQYMKIKKNAQDFVIELKSTKNNEVIRWCTPPIIISDIEKTNEHYAVQSIMLGINESDISKVAVSLINTVINNCSDEAVMELSTMLIPILNSMEERLKEIFLSELRGVL